MAFRGFRKASSWAWLCRLLAVALVGVFATVARAQSAKPLDVLVVFSWSAGNVWHEAVERGLRKGLAEAGFEPNYYLEFLDDQRFLEPELDAVRQYYLAEKYKKTPLDIIVAESRPAVAFLEDHPDLFPGIERVLVQTAMPTEKMSHTDGAGTRHLTIFPRFDGAVRDMVRLVVPKTIFILSNTTTAAEQMRIGALMSSLAENAPGIAVEKLVDLPIDDLMTRIANLPERSAIFVLPIFGDNTGKPFDPIKWTPRMAAAANAPMFSNWESYIGLGIVGGYLESGERLGAMTARTVASMFGGPPVTPSEEDAYAYYYDWRQIQRWNIDPDKLPEGAELRYRMPSAFDLYRWQIFTALGVITLLTVLTIVLLIVNRQRQWAIGALRMERTKLEIRVAERTQELSNEIAERSRLEDQLVRTERMRAIGRVTSGIAHHFNNINMALIGSLELAGRSIEKARGVVDPTKCDVEGIVAKVNSALKMAWRSAELTRQLTAYAQQKFLQSGQTDVNALIREAVEQWQADLAPAITVRTVLTGGLPQAAIESETLLEMVKALFNNAHAAMDGAGALTVMTRMAEPQAENGIDDAVLGSARHSIALTVSDTGRGMAREVAEKAVEPFFTTAEVGRGAGLGLSMVFGLARQVGGDLVIDSVEGKGTTVTVILPAAKENPGEK